MARATARDADISNNTLDDPFLIVTDKLSKKATYLNLHGKLCISLIFVFLGFAECYGASSAFIIVPDQLFIPGEQGYIEASLYRSGPLGLFARGISGELLAFNNSKGERLESALTDRSGTARIPFSLNISGPYPVSVNLIDNPRFFADAAVGHLYLQRKGYPLFFTFLEGTVMPEAPSPLAPFLPEKTVPLEGSQKALSAIASCYTNVYLSSGAKRSLPQLRQWLEGKNFPKAPIYSFHPSLVQSLINKDSFEDTDIIESLWHDRSLPAYLATNNQDFAYAAKEKGYC